MKLTNLGNGRFKRSNPQREMQKKLTNLGNGRFKRIPSDTQILPMEALWLPESLADTQETQVTERLPKQN